MQSSACVVKMGSAERVMAKKPVGKATWGGKRKGAGRKPSIRRKDVDTATAEAIAKTFNLEKVWHGLLNQGLHTEATLEDSQTFCRQRVHRPRSFCFSSQAYCRVQIDLRKNKKLRQLYKSLHFSELNPCSSQWAL